MDRERFEELKEAYALGALSDEERRKAEEYLAAHPEYQAEIDDLIATASLLALSPEEHDPPRTLRRNIMHVVEAEAESPGGWDTSLSGALGRLFGLPGVAFGASVVILVAGLLWWNVMLQDEVRNLQTRVQNSPLQELQASGMARGTNAEMVEVDEGRMVLVAEGLPSVPEENTYQMWVIEDGEPRSGGVFRPGGHVTAAPLEASLEDADAVAVTLEPARGSPQPTSDPVLSAKL